MKRTARAAAATSKRPRKATPEGVWIDYMRLADLDARRWPGNPKEHDGPSIQGSVVQHGFADPPMLDEGTGRLVKGHGRLDAVQALRAAGQQPPDGVQVAPDGEWLVPVVRGKRWPTEGDAEAYLLADNQLAIAGGWNLDALTTSLQRLQQLRVPVMNLGWGTDELRALVERRLGAPPPGDPDAGAPPDKSGTPGNLAARFVVPPFSVLDARQGYWQDRKAAWVSLGIESEQGRAVTLRGLISATQFQEGRYDERRGAEVDGDDKRAGTSIFDPVLCELVNRWFSPPGGKVLDPFAGGSVRGVVSALLGRAYTGVDLRQEQIAANADQWIRISARGVQLPEVQAAVADAVTDPAALTPLQQLGDLWVKRDDLFTVGGVWGGKVRTCWALAQGAKGLVTAGSLASPQVNIVAHVAKALGIPCRVHTPTGKVMPEVQAAVDAGAELVQHRPGYNSVIIARAHTDAGTQGYAEIPFGMECAEAVRQTRAQVRDLPPGIKRIVIPVGSGMSLAGLLWGLRDAGVKVPVVGVVVGADPHKRLAKFAPSGWQSMVQLVPSGSDYHKPATTTALHGVELDPYYEAKCLPHLQPGDLFWVVGVRQVVRAQAPAAAPPRVVHLPIAGAEDGPPAPAGRWKLSAAWASKRVDCTPAGITREGGCSAACCYGPTFWPGKASGRADHACVHLGPNGCTFAPGDKPVLCHLYPLKLNKGGTLVMHHRAPVSCCKPNAGRGDMLVDVLRGSLEHLFGPEQAAAAVEAVHAGRDALLVPPPSVLVAVAREEAWAEQNVPPQPRSGATTVTAPQPVDVVPPRWVVGDSREIGKLAPGAYDLVFTCPPYADLEVYSDDERDISRLDYPAFLAAYRAIIKASVGLLRPDRFAAIVVGDVRGPDGCYRNFVSDTIAAFRDAGAQLHNEAILVTPVGSLPIRAGRQFAAGRKLGKTHQQLLVFVKGDPAKATLACGPVDVSFPDGAGLDAGATAATG